MTDMSSLVVSWCWIFTDKKMKLYEEYNNWGLLNKIIFLMLILYISYFIGSSLRYYWV